MPTTTQARRVRVENYSRLSAAGEADGIPETTCRHCGLLGPHADRGECIAALRSELAIAQFKAKGNGRPRSKARVGAGDLVTA